MSEVGLTPELCERQIEQLDDLVSQYKDTVWASFVPLFAVGDSALLEQKVEESFSLYLRFIDKQIAGRKNKIPRITWRHWYSTKRAEYGFLHFHILYLLDGTGISTDQMETIHEQALAEIERLDNGKKLEDIRIALENKELRKWASKAGQNYKPAKHYKHKPVINKDASVAMKSNDNNKCVGYGSKAHKLKRNHDGKVFEIYSTTPSHTALKIR